VQFSHTCAFAAGTFAQKTLRAADDSLKGPSVTAPSLRNLAAKDQEIRARYGEGEARLSANARGGTDGNFTFQPHPRAEPDAPESIATSRASDVDEHLRRFSCGHTCAAGALADDSLAIDIRHLDCRVTVARRRAFLDWAGGKPMQ